VSPFTATAISVDYVELVINYTTEDTSPMRNVQRNLLVAVALVGTVLASVVAPVSAADLPGPGPVAITPTVINPLVIYSCDGSVRLAPGTIRICDGSVRPAGR
jgi:hypothetical protein